MHDIDRTGTEYGLEVPGYEAEQFGGAGGRSNAWSSEGESFAENGVTLDEADEYELATELLGVASEGELDQFLGNLIKKVGQRIRKRVRLPIGQAIGGVLKGVAKKALPLAGAFVAGPLGAKIGSGLASAANDEPGTESGEQEQEQEQEDQEYEGAKQFVRLAADTVTKAIAAPASADPRAVAQSAAIRAARQLAPGLLKKIANADGGGAGAARGQSGRWARRGDTIVLYGV